MKTSEVQNYRNDNICSETTPITAISLGNWYFSKSKKTKNSDTMLDMRKEVTEGYAEWTTYVFTFCQDTEQNDHVMIANSSSSEYVPSADILDWYTEK